jgi:SAM-dependent methyltransferase
MTLQRESQHWDEAVSFEETLDAYQRGPDPNTEAILRSAAPESGPMVLDFGCGGGVEAAWLAARGARVVGVDISARSVEVARRLFDHLGLTARFEAGDVAEMKFPEAPFDAIIGRFVLHHVDVAMTVPILASLVKPGGTAAFVETMASNRLLMLARDHLTGRFGIPRFGSPDEHPLTDADVARVRYAFGDVKVITERLHFLSIFDRQVLRYRWPKISKLASWADERLESFGPTSKWGYHQALIARRVG